MTLSGIIGAFVASGLSLLIGIHGSLLKSLGCVCIGCAVGLYHDSRT